MSSDLAQMECVPCRGGVPPLEPDRIKELLGRVNGWTMIGDNRIFKRYEFPDFAGAWALVSNVAELSEQQGHHPNITFGWGYAQFTIWTHAIDHLTESDFILAAKIDELTE